MSLKQKFIFAFLIAFILPLFVLGTFNHFHVKKLLQDEIIQEYNASILAKVEKVEIILDSNIRDLLWFRNGPVIQGLFRALQTGQDPLDKSTLPQWKNRVVSVAFEALEQHKNWEELFCLDTQGNEIIRVSREPDGTQVIPDKELQNRKETDYFKEALKLDAKAVYASSVSIQKKSSETSDPPDQAMIYFSAPIFGNTGNEKGVLVMRYHISSLLEELSQTNRGYIVLTDQNGYFLYHPEELKILSRQQGKASGDNFFEEHPENKKNISDLEFNHYHDIQDEQYRTWKKIHYAPGDSQRYWILFSIIPEKVFFAPIYKFRNISLIICFLAILLGICLILFISAGLTQPLQRLIKGARAIGRGNLDERIGMHRRDEIGEVANAFDQMAENLKKITAAEQANRTAYQSMFENASLGLILVNDKGEIKEVNPYANHLFGYSENELLGKKIEVLVPTSVREKHVALRTHYIEKPKSRVLGSGMDLSALRKDGSEFPVEISLAFYKIGDNKEVVSFISDITERKKAEEALKKLNLELEEKVKGRTQELSHTLLALSHINDDLNHEMEHRKKIEEKILKALEKEKELGELKSRFVSMASHEFRTPLAGILTSANLIARYSNSSDEEKRARHVNTIKASVKNLTIILNDFLSLDKLEEGKVACYPTHFQLTLFITQLLEEMQFVTKKGQKLISRHQGDNDQVFMDQDILQNILINLMSNAMKYSPEDSEIRLDVELKPSQVIFKIEDEGIGIPEEDQKHLFDRFFRAQNAVAIQGTGLGLNIIKKYLSLMEGSIYFTSRENKGSIFTITLPRGTIP